MIYSSFMDITSLILQNFGVDWFVIKIAMISYNCFTIAVYLELLFLSLSFHRYKQLYVYILFQVLLNCFNDMCLKDKTNNGRERHYKLYIFMIFYCDILLKCFLWHLLIIRFHNTENCTSFRLKIRNYFFY